MIISIPTGTYIVDLPPVTTNAKTIEIRIGRCSELFTEKEIDIIIATLYQAKTSLNRKDD